MTYLAMQKRECIDLYMESAAERDWPVHVSDDELGKGFWMRMKSAYRVIQIYDKGLS